MKAALKSLIKEAPHINLHYFRYFETYDRTLSVSAFKIQLNKITLIFEAFNEV